MHFFIDGYNFLFRVYEEVDPLRQKREEVIELLEESLSLFKYKITIVFDSHHTKESFFPKRYNKSLLEIIYTPSDQSADQYLIELLEYSKNNGAKTIVTSDKFLAKQARICGAHAITISSFLKKIFQKQTKKFDIEKKEAQESSGEFHRLLEAFEKKLKDDLY